ncbi:hypothetical protein MMC25_008260 [Agyrium rufum]|nr:hypothetical protein [Agyrium rufum]
MAQLHSRNQSASFSSRSKSISFFAGPDLHNSWNDRPVFLPTLYRNPKVDSVLGISSDTTSVIGAKHKKKKNKLQKARLWKKGSGITSNDAQDASQRHLLASRDDSHISSARNFTPMRSHQIRPSSSSTNSSVTYDIEESSIRRPFDPLLVAQSISSISQHSSGRASKDFAHQKGFPHLERSASPPSVVSSHQVERHNPFSQCIPHRHHGNLKLSRFVPKLHHKASKNKLQQTVGPTFIERPGTSTNKFRPMRQISPKRDIDERKEEQAVNRNWRQSRSTRTVEEMHRWLQETEQEVEVQPKDSYLGKTEVRDFYVGSTSPALSIASSASTSIRTLTSEKSAKRRSRKRVPKDSAAMLANEGTVIDSEMPPDEDGLFDDFSGHHDLRDLHNESVLSISTSAGRSTIEDFMNEFRDPPHHQRQQDHNLSMHQPQNHLTEIQAVYQRRVLNEDNLSVLPLPQVHQEILAYDSQKTTPMEYFGNQRDSVGSAWHWSGAKRPGIQQSNTQLSTSRLRNQEANDSSSAPVEQIASTQSRSRHPSIQTPNPINAKDDLVMVVTRQEEQLLSAMREKRASMHFDNLTSEADDSSLVSPTSSSARQRREVHFEPSSKTSEASSSVKNPSLILHGTDMSSFPSPPSSTQQQTFLRHQHSRSSNLNTTDNLTEKSYLASIKSSNDSSSIRHSPVTTSHAHNFSRPFLSPASSRFNLRQAPSREMLQHQRSHHSLISSGPRAEDSEPESGTGKVSPLTPSVTTSEVRLGIMKEHQQQQYAVSPVEARRVRRKDQLRGHEAEERKRNSTVMIKQVSRGKSGKGVESRNVVNPPHHDHCDRAPARKGRSRREETEEEDEDGYDDDEEGLVIWAMEVSVK